MWQSGSEMANAYSRKAQFGKLSGPDDLCTSIRSSSFNTSNTVISWILFVRLAIEESSLIDWVTSSRFAAVWELCGGGVTGFRSCDTSHSTRLTDEAKCWMSPSAALSINGWRPDFVTRPVSLLMPRHQTLGFCLCSFWTCYYFPLAQGPSALL